MKVNRVTVSMLLMISVILFSLPLLKKSNYNLSKENLISEDRVDKIVIKSKESKIVIHRDAKWFIVEPIKCLGDSKKIDNLLNILRKTKIENIVTDNVKIFDRFDVDDKNGIIVSMYKDNYLLKEIIIGKMDNNFSKSYVRIGEGVYLIDSNISYIFHMSVDELRDKKIFNIKKDQIAFIEIKRNKEIESIVKRDNRFYLNNKEYKNIETFIDKILDLRVHKFMKKDEVVKALDQDYITLEIRESNNQLHKLVISKKEEPYRLSMYSLLNNELYFNIFNHNLKQIQEFKFE